MRSRFVRHTEDESHKEKVLDVDASMQGTLFFKDPVNLRINGRFEGKLNTKGSLMIGQNADVAAELHGESITIAGKVRGNVRATKELKLISPAVIIGNIETPLLSVAEGAVIDGSIRMSQTSGADLTKTMLSVDEVAKYLEIDNKLVSEWADNGKLPGIKDTMGWRFDRETIDRWVSNEKIN